MGYVEELRKLIGNRCIILNGSVVIIRDKNNKLLLQQRTHPKGKWNFPGGLMELGESTVETAKREVFEETNLIVDDLKLIGVYSGKNHLCSAKNGDQWYVVTTAYTTNNFKGTLKINDDESERLEWFSIQNIPEEMASTHKIIINDFIDLLDNNKI